MTALRRTHNGDPTITAEYFRRRQSPASASVVGRFTDPERLAEDLLEELGPAVLNRLGWACLALVRDVS